MKIFVTVIKHLIGISVLHRYMCEQFHWQEICIRQKEFFSSHKCEGQLLLTNVKYLWLSLNTSFF